MKTSLVDLPYDILMEILSFILVFRSEDRQVPIYETVNLQMEEMKQIVINLQSTCSFFSKTNNRIGIYLNEFWLNMIEREFIGTKYFDGKIKKKALKNSKRYYSMISKMMEMKYREMYIPIQLDQLMMDKSNSFKLGFFGEYGSGVSSLYNIIVHDTFDIEYDPTIEDRYKKSYKVNENYFYIDFMDLCIREEFNVTFDRYVADMDVIVVVFSVIPNPYLSIQESYKELEKILQKIERIKDSNHFPCVIALTKCDLAEEHDIKLHEYYIKKIIRENLVKNCGIIRTSAKIRFGIDKLIEEAANRYLVKIPTNNERDFSYYKNKRSTLDKILNNEKEVYRIITDSKKSCCLM